MPSFDYIPPAGGLAIEQGYSTIWEKNLFYSTWLQPERTFTSKYFVDGAGVICVRKPDDVDAAEPGAPGRMFEHGNPTDNFVPIYLCNNFQKSDPIYQVTLESVSQNDALRTSRMETVIDQINAGVNLSALAALVDQSTAKTVDSATTKTAKEIILRARREAVENKAVGLDTVLCTPAFYETIMLAAGDKFDTEFNNRIASEGRVGRWLGMDFYEVNGFSAGSAKYYKNFDDAKTKSMTTADFSKVSFVMYNHNAFSVLPNLVKMGLVDGTPLMNGVFAQGEANFGFKVTNEKLAYVYKTA